MKCLTFNLQADHKDYFTRLPNVLALIRSENPDIISLQEVRIGSYDIIISFFSDYNHCLNDKVKFHRLYGEILLTKSVIVDSSYIRFQSINNRGLTSYKINDDFIVMTSHLDIGKDQNVIINGLLRDNPYKYIILLGDFNFFCDTMKFDSLIEVPSDKTFKNDKYHSRPDRIYYKNFNLLSSYVVETSLSDHCMLIAIF